jgi:hypothetical protein
MIADNPITQNDVAMKRRADLVSIGVFLIIVGVLWLTDWWWPFILVAPGLAIGAGLISRREVRSGIAMLALFGASAIVLWAMQETGVDWDLVGGLFVVGMGVLVTLKALTSRDDVREV